MRVVTWCPRICGRARKPWGRRLNGEGFSTDLYVLFLTSDISPSSIQILQRGIMLFTAGLPWKIYLRSVTFNKGWGTLIGNPVTSLDWVPTMCLVELIFELSLWAWHTGSWIFVGGIDKWMADWNELIWIDGWMAGWLDGWMEKLKDRGKERRGDYKRLVEDLWKEKRITII